MLVDLIVVLISLESFEELHWMNVLLVSDLRKRNDILHVPILCQLALSRFASQDDPEAMRLL